jgi:hypothetical protein
MAGGILAEFLRAARARERERQGDFLLILGALRSYHLSLAVLCGAVARLREDDSAENRNLVDLALANARGWLREAGDVEGTTT